MTRLASVVLGLSIWCGGSLSAQQPGQSALRLSVEREAANLASTLGAQNLRVDDAASLRLGATGTSQSDDWSAVRQLSQTTRIVVTTSQNKTVRGRISEVGDGTLRLEDRHGEGRTLRREDVLEVHLDRNAACSTGFELSIGNILYCEADVVVLSFPPATNAGGALRLLNGILHLLRNAHTGRSELNSQRRRVGRTVRKKPLGELDLCNRARFFVQRLLKRATTSLNRAVKCVILLQRDHNDNDMGIVLKRRVRPNVPYRI